MDIHVDVELVAQVALALIAAGIVVTKLIDALQAHGTIKPGQAGDWNQAAAFFVALATFIIRWVGFEGGIPEAESLGVELSGILVTGFTVAVISKGLHYVVQWLEGRRRKVILPEVPTPNVVINMEATPAPK